MEKRASYHIFYYAFLWYDYEVGTIPMKNKEKKKQCVWQDLKGFTSNTKWKRVREVDNSPAYFDEMCYFYEYTHQILFDKHENTHVLHFERVELEENNSQVRYVIEAEGKAYNLKVDKICLDLYELVVGILSFYVENDMEDFDAKDVCAINFYGRCVYLPFRNAREVFCIPSKLSIIGLGDEYSHEYKSLKDSFETSFSSWELPKHIYKLLCSDLFCSYSNAVIAPALDNRMFVNCWYYDNDLAGELSSLDLKKDKNDSVFIWKAFYGIDKLDSSEGEIDNEEVCAHTYTLWQNGGTLYGYTRYSFVVLTNTQFIKKHIQTLYSRILKLVLLQKSSILHFSKDIGVISLNQDNEEFLIKIVQRMYNQYITFLNHIYFDDITPQTQGMEFYNILQRELEVVKGVTKLNQSIGEVYNSLSAAMYASKRDRQSRALNWIAVLFLPPSLVTGFCGMSQLWYKEFTFDLFMVECLWSVVITLMLACLFWIITRSSDKSKKPRLFS